jgi:aminopeptidase I
LHPIHSLTSALLQSTTAIAMVRKTPSGFFSIQDDLPYRISRGYDRCGDDSSPPPAPALAKSFSPDKYTLPYIKFMTENPTVFHAVSAFTKQLTDTGYEYLSERTIWKLKPGGKYYTTRNGSSFIAFVVGKNYKPGNGVGIVAGHVDALTAKVKPVAKLSTKAGYVQLGVAPYGGGMNSTWWDRDLGMGGRVLIKNKNGKIEEKLVKLDWPIARVPTLAPHFGAAAIGPFNPETQMVPIIGLDNSDITGEQSPSISIPVGTFAATQPPRLVRAIASSLGTDDYSSIVNWELELFDVQPAQLGGLDHEFIFAGRIDDKLCCYAAVEALLASSDEASPGIVKMVGCFDDEEVGSYLRQGARSNFMSSVIERICEATSDYCGANLVNQTLANSFLVSSDVIHAVNPNFLGAYLENHSPRLNIGVAISADPNGHMTTDSVSTALLSRVAEKCGSTLQVFQIRNDSRSGGTIGPMTSSRLGCRAIDAGIPQLSMHSIRATTGSLDPGLGVKLFKGFFDYYEEVDKEFQ